MWIGIVITYLLLMILFSFNHPVLIFDNAMLVIRSGELCKLLLHPNVFPSSSAYSTKLLTI